MVFEPATHHHVQSVIPSGAASDIQRKQKKKKHLKTLSLPPTILHEQTRQPSRKFETSLNFQADFLPFMGVTSEKCKRQK